jgi:hypothetical protein
MAALTAFAVGNRDLDRLADHLKQFNLFDAIGVRHQELRHSDFLAYLLNPVNPHGLDEILARRLVQRAISRSDLAPSFSVLELELLDWSKLELRREWRHIDLLLVDTRQQIVIAFENKLRSREHSNQLDRYASTVIREFPNYRHLFFLLTPDGEPATDDRYLSMTYTDVAEILSELIDDRGATLDPGVKTVVSHYVGMLRRHVVGDSEFADLARKIYAKHKEAIDLIIEHRPDVQSEIASMLIRLIESTNEVYSESHGGKTWIRFSIPEWDIPVLKKSVRWTKSRQILMFEFGNFPNQVFLKVVVGPGDTDTRMVLFEHAAADGGLLSIREGDP